jgi:hypothetical protein
VEPPAVELPSADELAAFLEEAQGELQIGATLADYPQAVGPALLQRLQLFVAEHRKAPYRGRGSDHDKAAPPLRATTRDAAG